MKITSVVVEPMPRVRGPRGHLVQLTDELGNVGVGEGAPLPDYSPDDIAGCPHLLRDLGARIGEVDDSATAIDRRLAVFAAVLDAAPAARFGLETALLDILSHRKKQPISMLLGGKENARVPVNGVIGTDGDVDAWMARAAALVARGVRVVKVKVGRSDLDFDREHDALRKLRASLPADIELRLDANGSFGECARDRLTAIADLAPSYVEEPTHGKSLLTLGACAVPWAVDESLADASLLDAFLEDSACSVVILKPAILGGVIRSRKTGIRARERKIGIVVTHLFDGSVGHGAACELALSLAAPDSLACGLDAYDGLAPSPYLTTPGFVTASNRIGRGSTA
ncbi:MAG: enolase C-terminal domain-like protein [Polyangiaceae bacterium]